DDVVDLGLRITEPVQGRRDGGVDDLEVAAAGQLLELDQGKIRLNTGGIAIHDQGDGAGRCDAGNLGVAIAKALAEMEHVVAFVAGSLKEIIGTKVLVEWERRDR